MDAYPNNSHRARDVGDREIDISTPPADDPKAKKVTTGEVKVKKKTNVGKFKDVFVKEDITNVLNYAAFDIIIPYIKRAIFDAFTDGLDMMLNGNESHRYRTSGGGARYSYDKVYGRGGAPTRDRDRGSYRYASGGYDFGLDTVIFSTRGDAEQVLMELEDLIEDYGSASVMDFYRAAGIDGSQYTFRNYGWVNLSNADVRRCRMEDGFIISLPKPKPINK